MAIIDLTRPKKSEKSREFPGRTVYVYECPECKKETRILCNSYRGKNPEPGIGGVFCKHCTKDDG